MTIIKDKLQVTFRLFAITESSGTAKKTEQITYSTLKLINPTKPQQPFPADLGKHLNKNAQELPENFNKINNSVKVYCETTFHPSAKEK